MTRKRARKILMSIGTSRNHANWGLTAKPRWYTNAGVVEDTLRITMYAKLLRARMEDSQMTAEYIDRSSLVARMKYYENHTTEESGEHYAYSVALREIRNAPAADVAPVVHGQWDGEGDGYADGEIVLDVWYCSKCGYCIDDGTDNPDCLPKYCPNCGARMDGAAE